MRIGMNLVPLRPGQMGGAEIYLRDMLAELLKQRGHEYTLVTADYNHHTLPVDSPNCQRILFVRESLGSVGSPARLAIRIANQVASALGWLRGRSRHLRAVGLRELIRRERLDLWFCPFTNLDPRVCPVPSVITVFDLQHEQYPEFFDPNELRHRRHFYPESCDAADHVIAISEFTRRGLIERYRVEPDRVTAIWLAAGSDFAWRDAAVLVPEVRERYALPSQYVFYPANTWHHKNHPRLIEALGYYRQQEGETLALVLTGVGKEGQIGLDSALEKEGLAGAVHMLGFVPRADLPALYAGAACLVFPSLFEGFGIPLVEAMLVGCPIAAANVGSIPEVVGDAAVLFDPRDSRDIARALAAVVGKPSVAADLTRRGRARAERFSPSKTAAQTLELFERVRRDTGKR
jgi:glycosyltransferase involved in cell wall biosynthesis